MQKNSPAIIREPNQGIMRWHYPAWFRTHFPHVRTFILLPVAGGWTQAGLVFGHWGGREPTIGRKQADAIAAMRKAAGLRLGDLISPYWASAGPKTGPGFLGKAPRLA